MTAKTEQPTRRRLRRARTEGDLPVSAALVSSIGLVAAVTVAPAAVSAAADRVGELLRSALAEPASAFSAHTLVREVAFVAGPLLVVAALASAVVGLAQTGGVIALRPLSPDLARLGPSVGLRRLWTARQSWMSLQVVLSIAIVLWLTLRVLSRNAAQLSAAVGDVAASGALARELGTELGWLVALAGLAIAGADLVLVWHWWRRRLRMTRAEVAEEKRTTEGDPHLRAARRLAHQRLLAGASVRDVETATLVISDGAFLAVALRYVDGQDAAPRVVASASGELTARFRTAAQKARVPVVPNPELARSLSPLDVGEAVPVRTYEEVARALRDARRGAVPRK
jgi:flagellar biosynthesis protein FlhB